MQKLNTYITEKLKVTKNSIMNSGYDFRDRSGEVIPWFQFKRELHKYGEFNLGEEFNGYAPIITIDNNEYYIESVYCDTYSTCYVFYTDNNKERQCKKITGIDHLKHTLGLSDGVSERDSWDIGHNVYMAIYDKIKQ